MTRTMNDARSTTPPKIMTAYEASRILMSLAKLSSVPYGSQLGSEAVWKTLLIARP